jgi:hypothetical protein
MTSRATAAVIDGSESCANKADKDERNVEAKNWEIHSLKKHRFIFLLQFYT